MARQPWQMTSESKGHFGAEPPISILLSCVSEQRGELTAVVAGLPDAGAAVGRGAAGRRNVGACRRTRAGLRQVVEEQILVRGTVSFEVTQLAHLTPDTDARAHSRREHEAGRHRPRQVQIAAAAPVQLRLTPPNTLADRYVSSVACACSFTVLLLCYNVLTQLAY